MDDIASKVEALTAKVDALGVNPGHGLGMTSKIADSSSDGATL